MNINIKLDRRKFIKLFGAAGVVAALPVVPAAAKETVVFPGATGSWGTIEAGITHGSVTLAGHTMPVQFGFSDGKWSNINSVTFPTFTESYCANSVTVDFLGEQYEQSLEVSYDVSPGDTAAFLPEALKITSE